MKNIELLSTNNSKTTCISKITLRMNFKMSLLRSILKNLLIKINSKRVRRVKMFTCRNTNLSLKI